MSGFCIAAVVRAGDRDAANLALRAAGLPWGLSVALPAELAAATHYAQHSWGDLATIDAMRAIPGVELLVWQGDEAQGPRAAIDAAWEWTCMLGADP